ncbi:PRELI-like family-domain-containing protein [Mycotypha africana]|uniref:PRELI-like family-domain-containing protein n=1 Tax=Mycotypha africana TaxID=64632 RepID=UPI002301F388|nr:PRELI-like family-domain-containing protein [Mycotypha africana]KAI8977510.1 PRELI-like family-domain-containing protein [Mycotypha africana]
MKFVKTVHTFDYEWNLVSAAQWQKYPNDLCPHVVHVDVLNRRVDPKTGVLITERLITVKQNAPKILLKLVGAEETQYVREVSTIDPKAKTFKMTSQNLSLCNLLKCNEEITYTVSPEHAGKTQFTSQASVRVGGFLSKWENYIEDFSIKRFQQNAQNGKEGFLRVLEKFVATTAAHGSSSTTAGAAVAAE